MKEHWNFESLFIGKVFNACALLKQCHGIIAERPWPHRYCSLALKLSRRVWPRTVLSWLCSDQSKKHASRYVTWPVTSLIMFDRVSYPLRHNPIAGHGTIDFCVGSWPFRNQVPKLPCAIRNESNIKHHERQDSCNQWIGKWNLGMTFLFSRSQKFHYVQIWRSAAHLDGRYSFSLEFLNSKNWMTSLGILSRCRLLGNQLALRPLVAWTECPLGWSFHLHHLLTLRA